MINRQIVLTCLSALFFLVATGAQAQAQAVQERPETASIQSAQEAIETSSQTGSKITAVLSDSEIAERLKVQEQQKETVLQLKDIQESLRLKTSTRRDLRLEVQRAGENVPETLSNDLKEINAEIELLEKTFEQIAIGGIDLSVFGIKAQQFDWREELILIVKPLIENVKGLTEKPRKLESLRRFITDKKVAKEASVEAIQSIVQLQEDASTTPVLEKLGNIEDEWKRRLKDIDREIQLAQYQLESLEGKNVPWFEILQRGALEFFSGRGLTLLLIVIATFFVWLLMRGILWLIRKQTTDSQDRSIKVRYRLAAYGYRLLTVLLIAIAIMMVLYFRQDLLLLAIMVVVLVGMALALKNLLPKYITESRLLLNMGGVREKERVIYNGVPWEVSSINMYSRLTNPEIRGGIRLPIGHMHDMISRSSYGEPWFPSTEGDWILDDGDPVKVVRQSVDVVELQDLNAVSRTMPTADYYQAGYPNLSRVDDFRIAMQFGIDYATQREDVEKIEAAFKKGLTESFKATEYSEHVMDVSVEFHSAGDSSLNYIMLTRFEPEAAKFYNRIKRRIQRACVMVCSENDWGIPFPQVSVHMSDASPKANAD